MGWQQAWHQVLQVQPMACELRKLAQQDHSAEVQLAMQPADHQPPEGDKACCLRVPEVPLWQWQRLLQVLTLLQGGCGCC